MFNEYTRDLPWWAAWGSWLQRILWELSTGHGFWGKMSFDWMKSIKKNSNQQIKTIQGEKVINI